MTSIAILLTSLLACDGCESAVDDTGPADTGATPDAPFTQVQARPHDTFGSLLVVSWEQDQPGVAWVEYQVDPGEWSQTPAVALEAGSHEQLVAGSPYDWTTRWRLAMTLDNGHTVWSTPQETTTGALPEGTPQPEVVQVDAAQQDPAVPYVMTSMHEPGAWDKPWWTIIVDRQARVVWARQSSGQTSSLFTRPALDGGSLLIDESTFWTLFDDGVASTVVRVQLDGTELERFPTSGLHHDFVELPDGGLAWGASVGATEELLELGPDGVQRSVWSCAEDGLILGPCSSNAMDYDPETDTYLFTIQGVQTVYEIDRASGENVRSFGQAPGSYTFTAIDEVFWKPHGVMWTPDGTLLLSSWDQEDGRRLVVREYSVDDAARELHQVWRYFHSDVFAYLLGDVARLPGGNTLHSTGREGQLFELTPGKTVAWQLRWDADSDLGQASPVYDLYALLPSVAAGSAHRLD